MKYFSPIKMMVITAIVCNTVLGCSRILEKDELSTQKNSPISLHPEVMNSASRRAAPYLDRSNLTKNSQEQFKQRRIKPKIERTHQGWVTTLDDKAFEPGKADLSPDAMSGMDKIAALAKKNPRHNVLIKSYVNNMGSYDYSLGFSERCANSVRFALINRGIASNRISTQSFGKNQPVSNQQELDRRVEIIVLEGKGNSQYYSQY